MKNKNLDNLDRKKIVFVFMFIDIVILISLVFVYLRENRITVSEYDCNNVNYIDECSTKEGTTPRVTAVSYETDSPKPSENVHLLVEPELYNSYLSNPGIGWQHDVNRSSSYLPETVAYSTRKEISWDTLNPADGLYDWSALDRQLSLAKSAKKLYSFRIYTMAGESFGGHKVPIWVIQKGARILSSGEPDYSNCVYQEEWGKFVQELIKRYDGNSTIAFIDISGYGDFNEWSWRDEQTRWDDLWEQHYTSGTANAFTIQTLDGQARRRLVDIFIGGIYERHECVDKDGVRHTVSYSYPGFSSTQLVMPYAGIVQSTQYVHSRRKDVGFRYDSLGRANNLDVEKVMGEISQIWMNAPVVFELSKPEEFNYEMATQMLQSMHASLIHNNDYQQSKDKLQELVTQVGYRYFLKQAQFDIQPYPSGKIDLMMTWQNIGWAPTYPKMGQSFQLYLFVVDKNDLVVADYLIPADILTWLPAESAQLPPPEYEIKQTFILPETISPDTYSLMVSILDLKTGNPIRLSFLGEKESGKYWLGNVTINAK